MHLPMNSKGVHYNFSSLCTGPKAICTVCCADCSLSAAMSGNTWRYWEFNEAFLKGALLNYCKCCVWIRSHLRWRWWGVHGAEDSRNLWERNLINVKWLFLPSEGQPKDCLCQEETAASRWCAAAAGRFIVFTLQDLNIMHWHLKQMQNATSKEKSHSMWRTSSSLCEYVKSCTVFLNKCF